MKRDWCLQERILSRRAVHFGAHFKFLANDTHSTPEIIDGILTPRGVSPSLGRRWTEIVTLYCFEDPDTFKNFEEDIKYAWGLWDKKIGKAGADSGHGLKFCEFNFHDSNYPYCFKLKGYDAAKKKVDAKGEDDMKHVCNDYCLALKYGLAVIHDYDTSDHIDLYHKDGKEWPLFPQLRSRLPQRVPLAFWNHRGVGFHPPEMIDEDELEIIEPTWEISDGDVERFQHFYPQGLAIE
ncbi:hypothetical protein DDE82_007761 [Stemphylium lycopersici]|nr:hypothetical protein DDE82_007761 [Stemphylium lycopersici]